MKAATIAAGVTALAALLLWLYKTNDQAAVLRETAATAYPLITAIEGYLSQHGRVPADLPLQQSPTPGGWTYTAIGQRGYDLHKKLGWDPSLRYRYRDGRAEWIFDPGDGTPERIVTP